MNAFLNFYLILPFVLAVLQLTNAQGTFVLTYSMLSLAIECAGYSALVYDMYPTNLPPISNFYVKEPDAVLTTRLTIPNPGSSEGNKHFCVAAFRGTQNELWTKNNPAAIQEWSQNLRGLDITLVKQCKASEGIVDAYNFEYKASVEQDIRNCMDLCAEEGVECDIVFTGHSQGGAVANVAAIYLRDLKPLVVTFGQPPVLGEGCILYIDSSRWYRFILANPGGPGLKYDIVPSLFPWIERFTFGNIDYGKLYGQEILLSSEDSSGVWYVGNNIHGRGLPSSLAAHSSKAYEDTLKKIDQTVSQGSVRTTGFANGAPCNEHNECSSGKCKTVRLFPLRYRCA